MDKFHNYVNISKYTIDWINKNELYRDAQATQGWGKLINLTVSVFECKGQLTGNLL